MGVGVLATLRVGEDGGAAVSVGLGELLGWTLATARIGVGVPSS